MRDFASLYLHSEAPVTYMIMLIIFIISMIAIVKQSFYFKLFFHPYSINKHQEYHRLFTGELVHNGIFHLLFNELVLYVSCANLESFLRKKSIANGSLEMLCIYLASYLISITVSAILHRHDFNYSSAGASASIMGCMMSFMILAPNFVTFYLPVIGAIRNKFTIIFYMLVLIIYQRRKKDDIINHEQHFFGAIGGIAATLSLFPEVL